MTAAQSLTVALIVAITAALWLAAELVRANLRRAAERNQRLAAVFAHDVTKGALAKERAARDESERQRLAAQDELDRLRLANVWLRREAKARFAGVMADWLALDVKDCPDAERLDGAP